MNEERLEHLVNEMYYNYLEQDEAKELIDYITNLQQELTKYKERCEKAIEYVKQLEHSDWVSFGRTILLEILQDKEDKDEFRN